MNIPGGFTGSSSAPRRSGCHFAVATIVAICASAPLNAQPYFVDDFDDGSDVDGQPVTWLRGLNPNADRMVVDGDYRWSDSALMSSVVSGLSFSDISVRTRARLLSPANPSTFAGVFARDSPIGAYFSGIRADGVMFIGIDEFSRNTISILEQQSSALDMAAHDINIQFDVVGDLLSLTVWQAESPMPVMPQLSIRDNTLSDGGVGLLFHPTGRESSVAFRSFAAVPEPSSVLLALSGLIAFLLGPKISSCKEPTR